MKKYKYLLILPLLVVAAASQFTAPKAAIAAESGARTLLKKCRVTAAEGADVTGVSTRKSAFLKSGTALTLVSPDMHQGYIAVKATVSGRLVTVSINAGDTDCLD